MTGKRNPGASNADSPSTLRSIEAAEVTSPDLESPVGPVYYEPQPLVAVSDHKTLELETVKLSEVIDPRKLPTELSLPRPPSVAPPDSGWPQADVVAVSSQPPLTVRRRWRTPAVLLLPFAALALLALARGRALRSPATAQTPTATVPIGAAPRAAIAPPAESAPAASPPEPAASANPHPEPPASRAHSPKSRLHPSLESVPSARSAAVAAPSVSKPKRAIY